MALLSVAAFLFVLLAMAVDVATAQNLACTILCLRYFTEFAFFELLPVMSFCERVHRSFRKCVINKPLSKPYTAKLKPARLI